MLLPHAVRARARAHHRQRRRRSAARWCWARARRPRLLLAGIHHQGWIVLGPARRRPGQAGRTHRRRAGARAAATRCATARALGAATHLIIAMPSATRRSAGAALELAATHRAAGADGAVGRRAARRQQRIDRLREIEPEDLLGREPVRLDEAGIAETLRGKTVLDHRRGRQHRQRAVPAGRALSARRGSCSTS